MLDEALQATNGDPAVTRRIADLALYVRHAELLLVMRQSPSPAAEKAFLQHLARIRHDQILPTRFASRSAPRSFPKTSPSIDWENAPVYTLAEISAMIGESLFVMPPPAFHPVTTLILHAA